MGTFLDDLWDHEGYGARRLPDGTLTATWSKATAAFDAHVAACSCGWHGGEHLPTDEGYEAAVDQWEADHARPLQAETVPDAVLTAVNDAKQAIVELARQRPEAARRALDDLVAWSGPLRQQIEPEAAAARLRQRLASTGRPDHGRTLRR